jgi:RHS repeat-associated protein
MNDAVGSSLYTYDLLNRLTNYVDAYGKSIGYEYDAASNRKALVYPDGKKVNYGFDAANRMTSAADWANRTTSYAYDPASMLAGLTNANGTTAGFTYDTAGRLISMNNRKSDQSVISTYSFTLDAVGNRTNINQTEPLIAASPAADTAYTYNAANQIQTAGPTAFASDPNGNLKVQATGGVARSFAYDLEDRLVTATSGPTSAQYVYNGDGIRLAKTIKGVTTRFVVDPNSRLQRVLAETDTSGAITSYYTHGLGMIAEATAPGDYYQYHYDVRGSTIAMTNGSQAIVNRYSYDPFGVVTASAELVENPFQYMGQHGVTREPLDLLFASRRFYNPSLGRFLTRDPAQGVAGNPQTFNEYVYSLNNPVMLIDPSGLSGERDGSTSFNNVGSSDTTNNSLLFNESRLLNQSIGTRLKNAIVKTVTKDLPILLSCSFTLGKDTSSCITTMDPRGENPFIARQMAAVVEDAGRIASHIAGGRILYEAYSLSYDYNYSRGFGFSRKQTFVRLAEAKLIELAMELELGPYAPLSTLKSLSHEVDIDLEHPFTSRFWQ